MFRAASFHQTFLSGWYRIRAVEPPNSHSYLQTAPTAAPGAPALLASYATAGQFNITDDGQLVGSTSTTPARAARRCA